MFLPENVIIADDHPLFRQALLETLKSRMPQTQFIEAETVKQLEEVLVEHSQADLLLLDLNIPGAHGFNTLIHVRQHYPHIPVIVVSAYEDRDTISQAIEYGASGFIPKSTDIDSIFNGISRVLMGEVWLPSGFDGKESSPSKSQVAEQIASLTQQQFKILTMFAEGLLNKQIAYQLNVSEATVKAHATAIFRKLHVQNRTQAVLVLNQLEITEDFSHQLNG
ncbi:DNA-binding response regulator [Parashewanella curva]|uniref:DNA-binding response regulator n=1 Tax=Parashewanella curva TaxID=2338552 RepID=A0A3L8PV59_9GAMM|nr:response regulator transcription factor [Parashewanella curva]RLV59305.1 DNA-binding response regulator [Parashewanella curva]